MVFAAFAVVGSRLVSNAPFVILAVANVIVLELAGSRARVGFWAFLRIGAAVTLATLLLGMATPLAERATGLL